MADYKVQLAPIVEGVDGDIVVVHDGDMGFNQFGWLCFTDGRREATHGFAPGSVLRFERINSAGEIIEVTPEDFKVSIN